jgi:hypothetical protein
MMPAMLVTIPSMNNDPEPGKRAQAECQNEFQYSFGEKKIARPSVSNAKPANGLYNK